jgi:cyclopropane-fatty-acyl-phospholipid synthase
LPAFDKIVSVGMFEHVGARNYRTFMRIVSDLLCARGLFVLHTIGQHGSTEVDPWVNRYIFPNSRLPTSHEIARASQDLLVLEDWQNFGADYDRTLLAWLDNFERHAQSPQFQRDESFRRMWRYFLLIFAGCFRVRDRCQLWQLVLSKGGCPGRYDAPRSGHTELLDAAVPSTSGV